MPHFVILTSDANLVEAFDQEDEALAALEEIARQDPEHADDYAIIRGTGDDGQPVGESTPDPISAYTPSPNQHMYELGSPRDTRARAAQDHPSAADPHSGMASAMPGIIRRESMAGHTSIDYVAAWATLGTALGTIGLAVATFTLARRTKTLADSGQETAVAAKATAQAAERELQLLRAQADAAERQSRAAEAALKASVLPLIADVPSSTPRSAQLGFELHRLRTGSGLPTEAFDASQVTWIVRDPLAGGADSEYRLRCGSDDRWTCGACPRRDSRRCNRVALRTWIHAAGDRTWGDRRRPIRRNARTDRRSPPVRAFTLGPRTCCRGFVYRSGG